MTEHQEKKKSVEPEPEIEQYGIIRQSYKKYYKYI